MENNSSWRCITNPPRRHTTTEKETYISLFQELFLLIGLPIYFFVVCICYCNKNDGDGADTTINREIGPVDPPEASPHTRGTTAPYGSIDQADDSLPTYDQALSMPSSYGHSSVPLSAPSLDDGRSPPAYSEINMQLSTSALRVSTVGWATRSPVASVNNMTTMTRY